MGGRRTTLLIGFCEEFEARPVAAALLRHPADPV